MQKEAASDRYNWPVLILAAVALAVVAETYLIAKVSPLLTADAAMSVPGIALVVCLRAVRPRR